MDMKATIAIKATTLKALMACHKIEQVKGYCMHCSNYGKNYSCPEFSFDIAKWLESYHYAYLIMTTIPTKALNQKIAYFKTKKYPSKIYNRYLKDGHGQSEDGVTAVSMYAFSHVKDYITKQLLKVEKLDKQAISIPPGCCTYCEICKKETGEHCTYPNKLRYSLESLGFLVSDVLKTFFDYTLEWSKEGFTDDFMTLSAVFTQNPISQDAIITILGEYTLVL